MLKIANFAKYLFFIFSPSTLIWLTDLIIHLDRKNKNFLKKLAAATLGFVKGTFQLVELLLAYGGGDTS